MRSFFRDQNDAVNFAKVDFTLPALQRLRDQALLARLKEIRDLAAPLTGGVGAPGTDYGLTTARVGVLGSAITAYEKQISAPTAARATRKTQTDEVKTSLAALLVDLDGLILQFAGTAPGDELIESWQNARNIIDRGHGPATPPTPPPAPGP